MLKKKITTLILACSFLISGSSIGANAYVYENYHDTPLGYPSDTDSGLYLADESFPLSVPRKEKDKTVYSAYTGVRRKYTKDSIYVKVNKVLADGASKSYFKVSTIYTNASGKTNIYCDKGTYYDMSKGKGMNYRTYELGERFVTNWVYEYGQSYYGTLYTDQSRNAPFAYCKLEFTTTNQATNKEFQGQWSPDCC